MRAEAVDTLIVGAGPTGLVMAAELARRGVRCRIIDRAPAPSRHSKALGIHARTLEVFQNMSLAGEIIAQGHPASAATLFSDGHRIAHLSFRELDSPYPFVLILPQSETERILGRHLARLGAAVERNVELQLAHRL